MKRGACEALPLDLCHIPYQPFFALFPHKSEEMFINGGIDDATDAGRREDR
jgi:hypothetical protein